MEREITRVLLEAIKAEVKATPDKKFDYRYAATGRAGCGCVIPVVQRFLKKDITTDGPEGYKLSELIGCTPDEGMYIFGYERVNVGPGCAYDDMTAKQAVGAAGKRLAVGRINRVLRNYR